MQLPAKLVGWSRQAATEQYERYPLAYQLVVRMAGAMLAAAQPPAYLLAWLLLGKAQKGASALRSRDLHPSTLLLIQAL